MNSILAIGTGAMGAALQRATRAALDVVTAGVPSESPASISADPQPTAGPAVLAPARTEGDPMLNGVVDLKLATHAYKAGAAIVRTADEIAEETLKII